MADAPPGGDRRIADLVDELRTAREEFLGALDAVVRERGEGPGLAGEWGARELIAHLGYWAGHGADAIHAVVEGRADEFEVGEGEVDARNETVARVARATDLATVRRREEASFNALLERIRALDAELLGVRLAQWGTLLEGIREDGAIHYRAHADELRGGGAAA
jgi:hypothetical protein